MLGSGQDLLTPPLAHVYTSSEDDRIRTETVQVTPLRRTRASSP